MYKTLNQNKIGFIVHTVCKFFSFPIINRTNPNYNKDEVVSVYLIIGMSVVQSYINCKTDFHEILHENGLPRSDRAYFRLDLFFHFKMPY